MNFESYTDAFWFGFKRNWRLRLTVILFAIAVYLLDDTPEHGLVLEVYVVLVLWLGFDGAIRALLIHRKEVRKSRKGG